MSSRAFGESQRRIYCPVLVEITIIVEVALGGVTEAMATKI
jgi:hypothetical protein